MKNTTTLIKTTLVAGIVAFAMTAKADTPTFETIRFDAPIFSAEDPLGVSAITKAQGDITTIQTEVETVSNEVETAKSAAATAQETATQAQTKATNLETTVAEVKEAVTNTISTTTVDGKKKSQLTGDVVVIGNVKDGNTDVVMQSGTNSIVFAVNRDIEDVPPEDGSIKFDADAIKFPGVNGIWFGDSTLATILGNAGQGEVNTINTIKVNGSALTPDSDRAVDITIPAPGDANVIEGITVNGTTITPDANKVVAITIPDAGQSNVIETVKVNGTALTPDSDKAVNITIPSTDNFVTETVTNGLASEAWVNAKGYVTETVTNGLASATHTHTPADVGITALYDIPGAEIAATNAIQQITDAQSISEIKTALTTFLNNFKKPAP